MKPERQTPKRANAAAKLKRGSGESAAVIQGIEAVLALVATTTDGIDAICKQVGAFGHSKWWSMLTKDKSLAERYASAHANRVDIMAADMERINDQEPWTVTDPATGITRIDPGFETWRKTRIDTRKWLLAKLAPKKYGDRTEVEHSGAVGHVVVSEAMLRELQQARRAALLKQGVVIEIEDAAATESSE